MNGNDCPDLQSRFTINVAQSNLTLGLLRTTYLSNDAPKPIILSPLSLSIVLSMVYLGAKGETAKEIGRIVSNDEVAMKIHEHFGSVAKKIYAINNEHTLTAANGIFASEEFSISEHYEKDLKERYLENVNSVDFGHQLRAIHNVNEFVKNKTNGSILTEKWIFEPITRSALISVTKFNGILSVAFEQQHAEPETFFVSTHQTKLVDMVQLSGKFSFYESHFRKVQVIGLPCKGNAMLYIILPMERYGLNKVLESLEPSDLMYFIRKHPEAQIELKLPNIDVESSLNLTKYAERVGLKIALTDKADFSGITNNRSLRISHILQQTSLKIDEIRSDLKSEGELVAVGEESASSVHMNHPFMFLVVIHRDRTNSIDNDEEFTGNSYYFNNIILAGIYS
ncbi:serpin (serine protease inhibitor) domain-containing protein [Ditylenchus destructor]|nr:serpin (serine protease inhibitor) domain-containing protein [Ditylenchus destructor]